MAQQPAPVQPAEQGQAGTYSLQIKSQLVVLDVVVTDKKGKAVGNLTRDSFKVYENNVAQTIQTFEPASNTAIASVTAGTGAPVAIHSTAELDKLEPQAPVSIIVLDEVTTKFEDEAFARFALKKYLGSEGDTLRQPTMLIAVSIEHQMVLRDYTTSKKEILDALDHHFADNDWRTKNAAWKPAQFGAAFASLEGVAEATAGHAGHKNIVWVGRGFPGFTWDQLASTASVELKQRIATCTNLLRDTRATLYSVDPAGVAAGPPVTHTDADAYTTGAGNFFDMDDPFGGQVDFDAMARATGGQAFHGRNDVDRLIGTSVSDGETFYTITYKPTAVSNDPREFRNIHVAMSDPSLTATTRQGYFVNAPPVAPMLDAGGKVSGQVALGAGEDANRRCAGEALAGDVPSLSREHRMTRRGEGCDVRRLAARGESEAGVGRKVEKVFEPASAGLFDHGGSGAAGIDAGILVPGAGEPVGGERRRERASYDPAEEASSRGASDAAVDPPEEVAENGLGIDGISVERKAQARAKLLERGGCGNGVIGGEVAQSGVEGLLEQWSEVRICGGHGENQITRCGWRSDGRGAWILNHVPWSGTIALIRLPHDRKFPGRMAAHLLRRGRSLA